MPKKYEVAVLARSLIAASLVFSAGLVQASPERVFVSASGHANHSCSLTAPCRTFAEALNAVADGGEVVALDTAGYGIVSITKSVTITAAPGVYADITAPSGANGITINAPGGNVRIRGISIDSQQAWTAPDPNAPVTTGIAINILAAANVSIEDCVVSHFPYMGVQALPAPASTQTTPLSINIVDSRFTEAGQFAVVFLRAANFASGGTVTANLRNVVMNGYNNWATTGNEAFAVTDGVSLTIDNCQILNYYWGLIEYTNSQRGYAVSSNSVWNNAYANIVAITGNGGTSVVDLHDNVLTGTSTAVTPLFGWDPTAAASIDIFSAGVSVSLDGNTISNNSIGVFQGAGVVSSFGNNRFISNGTDVSGSLTPVTAK
jgi:hypothetical protein